MDIRINYRDGRTETIGFVIGSPSEIDVLVRDGYYRDQFTLESNVEGLVFPGQGGTPPEAQNIAVPDSVFTRVVPVGPVEITLGSTGDTSKLTIGSFKTTVSDEIAHEPLRQISYIQSYWVFPCFKDAIQFNSYFRKAVVDGWGIVPAEDDD